MKNKFSGFNWISEGIAAVNDAMRIGSNKVDILSENILMTVVRYTKAVLGGIYIHTTEEDGDYLTLNAAIALGKKKAVKIKTILFIPFFYVTINTARGSGRPERKGLLPGIIMKKR